MWISTSPSPFTSAARFSKNIATACSKAPKSASKRLCRARMARPGASCRSTWNEPSLRIHRRCGTQGFMTVSRLLAARAPAKINLTLHIEGRRPDGYHELQSLVAFAGAGDFLTFEPAEHFDLTLEGPTATAAGDGGDNLVARAERALRAEKPDLRTGRFHLVKRLPVSAGIGGGSSDAAAALRLLAEANGIAVNDPALFEAARKTGADIPVCLAPRAKFMRGVGERLGPPMRLPPLFTVLVNPRQGVETREVFQKLGLKPGETLSHGPHPVIAGNMDFESLLRALKKG